MFDLVLPATTSSVVKRTWVSMYKFMKDGEFARGKQAAQIAMTMGADTVRAVCTLDKQVEGHEARRPCGNQTNN